MLSYLILYLSISYKVIRGNSKFSYLTIITLFLFLSFFIGFRHQIGVDWDQYVEIIDRFKDDTFSLILVSTEPGYIGLSWIGGRFENGIYLVNFISACIFTFGLIEYARKRDYPWLAILLAFPILIVMVAMGYTRQSIAIGFEFLALNSIENKNIFKALILIVIGSLFHISILGLTIFVIDIPIKRKVKLRNLITFSIVIYLGYLAYALISETIYAYYKLYILRVYASSGALYRLIPSVFAALILISNKIKLRKYDSQNISIYMKMAYAIILSIILVLLFPSNSTFIDRFALYLYPLTIYVFNKSISLQFFNIRKIDYKLIFITTYFIYTFFWLSFAKHAYAWIPYQNYFFMPY